MTSLPPLPLPEGVRSRTVDCTTTTGLTFHYLEAGHEASDSTVARHKPLLLFLHGFPELAYSWRKVLVPLSTTGQGFHAVAVDQRGHGRTHFHSSAAPTYDSPLYPYRTTNLIADLVAFVHALGHSSVHTFIGHDFGAYIAGYAALFRPDFFKSVVLLSHPFKGAPSLPFNVADPTPTEVAKQRKARDEKAARWDPKVHQRLAELTPPRTHYTRYNSGPSAAEEWSCAGDRHALRKFLRGYFHLKSADWDENAPFPFTSFTASELAKLPHYYVMPRGVSMPETVARDMATTSANYSKTETWLPPAELEVYVDEWARTGFQGGLNWYSAAADSSLTCDLNIFAGRRIECPALLVNGEKDWGKYQRPGEMEGFEEKYEDLRGVREVRAGHWPQQEDAVGLVRELASFLQSLEHDKA